MGCVCIFSYIISHTYGLFSWNKPLSRVLSSILQERKQKRAEEAKNSAPPKSAAEAACKMLAKKVLFLYTWVI